jgi:hypothetical protein
LDNFESAVKAAPTGEHLQIKAELLEVGLSKPADPISTAADSPSRLPQWTAGLAAGAMHGGFYGAIGGAYGQIKLLTPSRPHTLRTKMRPAWALQVRVNSFKLTELLKQQLRTLSPGHSKVRQREC